jgi:UDP-2,3-diacylglucosamine pyrophosphatase LpxH
VCSSDLDKVKGAIKFITSFEEQLVYRTKKRDCESVVCGHIHFPVIKDVDGIRYVNCGDWIENNTYVIFNENKFTLHEYKE